MCSSVPRCGTRPLPGKLHLTLRPHKIQELRHDRHEALCHRFRLARFAARLPLLPRASPRHGRVRTNGCSRLPAGDGHLRRVLVTPASTGHPAGRSAEASSPWMGRRAPTDGGRVRLRRRMGQVDAGARYGGQVLPDGATCPAGETVCGGACVDLTSDPLNCGACSTVCGAGQVCSNSACTATCAITGSPDCDGVRLRQPGSGRPERLRRLQHGLHRRPELREQRVRVHAGSHFRMPVQRRVRAPISPPTRATAGSAATVCPGGVRRLL